MLDVLLLDDIWNDIGFVTTASAKLVYWNRKSVPQRIKLIPLAVNVKVSPVGIYSTNPSPALRQSVVSGHSIPVDQGIKAHSTSVFEPRNLFAIQPKKRVLPANGSRESLR